MKQYQLLFLTYILYCTTEYKCSVFCAKSNEVQSFASAKLKHPEVHNYYQDFGYKVHSKRELKETDFNINSNSLTKGDRISRGIPASRRHLRLGDAHQIANYFLTGGPLKGHAHFIRERNCDSNNNENNENNNKENNVVGMNNPISENNKENNVVGMNNPISENNNKENDVVGMNNPISENNNKKNNVVGMNNPISENNTDLPSNKQNLNTNVSDSIVGIPHIPILHSLLGDASIIQPSNLYKSAIDRMHSILQPTLNTLTAIPHTPVEHTLLGSLVHPRLHPHISALHSIPSTLVRAASIPVHGLLQAQSELHNMLQPHGLVGSTHLLGNPNKASKRAKAKKNSRNNMTYLIGQYSPLIGASPTSFNHKITQSNMSISQLLAYPKPTGYVVRFVPHNKAAEPSDYTDNKSNTKEDVTSFTNNDNQDANEDQ